MQPDNPFERLSDEDLLDLRDRQAQALVRYDQLSDEEKHAARPKGAAPASTAILLNAHFFMAAEHVLRQRGIIT